MHHFSDAGPLQGLLTLQNLCDGMIALESAISFCQIVENQVNVFPKASVSLKFMLRLLQNFDSSALSA